MRPASHGLCALAALVVLLPSPARAQTPLGTVFTYQGQLKQSGSPASGAFNMDFKLYDALTIGNQVGPTLFFNGMFGNPPPVSVTNGLFTVQLDFGAVYNGDKRWLEITVSGTTLAPRQELTATPYAMKALSAPGDGTGPWLLNGLDAYYNSGNVGVGMASPAAMLDVAGTVQATGLKMTTSPTAGFVLTSDAAGQGSWQAPSGGSSEWTTSGSNIHNNNTGNVGIGTTTPNTKLTVQTASNQNGIVHTDGTKRIATFLGGSTCWFGTTTPHDLELMINNSPVIYLTSGRVGINDVGPSNPLTVSGDANFNGSVGIGTTSPTTSLAIAGANNFGTGGASIYLTNTTPGTGRTYLLGSTTGGLFQIGDVTAGLATRVVVDSGGNVGIGTTGPTQKLHVVGNIQASGSVFASCGTLSCSDARFKTRIEPMRDALSLVERLRPVRFDWCREEFPDRQFGDQRQIGLIAQEVREVAPEVVQDCGDGYLSVDYGRLTPVIVQAVKDLRAEKNAEIDRLTCENEALRADIASLNEAVRQLIKIQKGERP